MDVIDWMVLEVGGRGVIGIWWEVRFIIWVHIGGFSYQIAFEVELWPIKGQIYIT